MGIEVKAINTRQKFICTNKDKIMFNGACYQLDTQTFRKKFFDYIPQISEKEFKRLMNLGVLSKPYKVKRMIEVTMYDFIIKE